MDGSELVDAGEPPVVTEAPSAAPAGTAAWVAPGSPVAAAAPAPGPATGPALPRSGEVGPTLPPETSPFPAKTAELLSAGEMVAEYEITGKLGEGGMGVVFAGVQPVIGKRVAVKVLQATAAANPELVNRFVHEARAVNQIRSRNIVDIFSFGNLADGHPYFVMEYLEGVSLRAFLREHQILRFEEAYALLRCVARGLEAAHAAGIVHRDLKPENVIVLEEDDVLSAKLLDFGIAKLTGTASEPGFSTRTGMTLGTPYYMSPEQARGIGVDHRTDIYALGVIMYEMFTGALPFAAKSYIDLVNQHLYAAPPPPRERQPDIAPELEALILRCIAKDPAQRPQSMAALLEALDALRPTLSGTSYTAAASAPATEAGASLSPVAVVNPEPASPPRTSRWRGIAIGGGVLAVLLIAGVAVLQWRGGVGEVERPSAVTPIVEDAAAVAAATADARAVAPASRPVAAPTTGRLTIATGHPRAVYRVDGAVVGRGRRITVELPVGEHAIAVSAPAVVPITQQVQVLAGMLVELAPKLVRARPGRGPKRPTKRPREGTTDDPEGTLNPFKRGR